MDLKIKTYDIWGNELDGYEINDVFSYGNFPFEGDFDNEVDILDFLQDNYFAEPVSIGDINLEYAEMEIFITDNKGKPICEIEKIEE